MNLETILLAVIIGAAVFFLLRRAVRAFRTPSGGCGRGCGCSRGAGPKGK